MEGARGEWTQTYQHWWCGDNWGHHWMWYQWKLSSVGEGQDSRWLWLQLQSMMHNGWGEVRHGGRWEDGLERRDEVRRDGVVAREWREASHAWTNKQKCNLWFFWHHASLWCYSYSTAKEKTRSEYGVLVRLSLPIFYNWCGLRVWFVQLHFLHDQSTNHIPLSNPQPRAA